MHAGSDIPVYITYIFAALLALMVISLALEEKLHAKKSLITGLAALVSLFLSVLLLPHSGKSHGHMPFYIPYVDWEVVLIILGSSLFVDVVSKGGIFSWIAVKLTKLSGGDLTRLLINYSILTVVFSAVLNNVTAMIIIGSLSAVSLKKLNQGKYLLGFLIIEGLLTNVGGLLTLISSVPNIIVGQKAGISFVQFFLHAAPYVLVAVAATIFAGKIMYKIPRLSSPREKEESSALLASFDENEGIPSRPYFYFSWFLFAALIFLFSAQSVLPVFKDLGLGFIAVGMALVALVRYKHDVDRNYRALDWDLLFFFVFLFIVIGVMEHAGVLKMLGGALTYLMKLPGPFDSQSILFGAAFASSVTDNIPLSAVLANIMGAPGLEPKATHWWAVIFGCNLGGNITPIGSASTVVAVTIIHKNELRLSFLQFVRAALPFALLQLILAGGYLFILGLIKN